MARRMRIQFPGAIYHVINRGNYRRDLFETAGAAKAFEATLEEGAPRFRWIVHAYSLMRNHFHLAVETPEPNLVEGMHWLQSTYATRYNRFRSERGHLFQGRFQSPLIESGESLVRVVDYIHLNPVEAGIVSAADAAKFRWSSLGRFVRGSAGACLTPDRWLGALGLSNGAAGWRTYLARLEQLAEEGWHSQVEKELCTGWAIGTVAWRRALAEEFALYKLDPGVSADEARDFKRARHQTCLDRALQEVGHTLEHARDAQRGVLWKRDIARRLRQECAAPYRWIADVLHMGSANSVRAYVHGK